MDRAPSGMASGRVRARGCVVRAAHGRRAGASRPAAAGGAGVGARRAGRARRRSGRNPDHHSVPRAQRRVAVAALPGPRGGHDLGPSGGNEAPDRCARVPNDRARGPAAGRGAGLCHRAPAPVRDAAAPALPPRHRLRGRGRRDRRRAAGVGPGPAGREAPSLLPRALQPHAGAAARTRRAARAGHARRAGPVRRRRRAAARARARTLDPPALDATQPVRSAAHGCSRPPPAGRRPRTGPGRRRRGAARGHGQGWAPEHPRRDDRRPGGGRRRPDAQRQAPARQARHDVRGRDRLVSAVLPGAGDLHHRPVRAQPRRRRQLLPVRVVRHEGPWQHAAARWLQKAGYRTALVGKWLNGYGAKDAHGEVPKGFDIWRGLLDVSAYDYYNFVMNLDGRLKAWGDSDFAHKLVQFASVEVSPNPGGLAGVIKHLTDTFGPGPYHYWGAENPQDYSPDVTGEVTEGLVRREARDRKPFFIWWAPAAPHREDVSVTLMGRPGPDPRYRSATPPRRPTGCCPSRRASPSRTWTRSPRTSATTPRRCRRTRSTSSRSTTRGGSEERRVGKECR